MIGAAQQLRLEALTIHAAVNYLDIILNRTFCSTDAYQLLAMACTFLAAKVHEQVSFGSHVGGGWGFGGLPRSC